jgi:hypothetical protein
MKTHSESISAVQIVDTISAHLLWNEIWDQNSFPLAFRLFIYWPDS